jgi:xylan 1,4-beta-xylosidase
MKEGVRAQPDISAQASLDHNKLCVLLWHYHDDDLPGPDANIQLTLGGLPLKRGKVKLRHFRIDENHSNAFAAWKRMGSPQQPAPDQYARLEAAGQLAPMSGPASVAIKDSSATLRFKLPRQAVSLLEFVW